MTCINNVQQSQPMNLEAKSLVAEASVVTTITDTLATAIIHTPMLSSKDEVASVKPKPPDERTNPRSANLNSTPKTSSPGPQTSSESTAITVHVKPLGGAWLCCGPALKVFCSLQPANVSLKLAAPPTKTKVAKLSVKESNLSSTRNDRNGAAALQNPVGKSRNTNTSAYGVEVQDETNKAGLLDTGLSDPNAVQTPRQSLEKQLKESGRNVIVPNNYWPRRWDLDRGRPSGAIISNGSGTFPSIVGPGSTHLQYTNERIGFNIKENRGTIRVLYLRNPLGLSEDKKSERKPMLWIDFVEGQSLDNIVNRALFK
ncbi:hypothetical protein ACEPPN_012047 [Leptodophora sp. 'Broadleaf-Isolate-01']